MLKQKIILKGIGASPGIIKGRVKVLHSPAEIAKMEEDDILVVSITNPLYTPAILKAAGIITDHGGALSHPATISRELAIPCVAGTIKATRILKDNMEIILDGKKGIIYDASR